jgi:hypothetical protein
LGRPHEVRIVTRALDDEGCSVSGLDAIIRPWLVIGGARYAVRPVSPLLTGVLVEANMIGAPFVLAGAVKACYDLGFWRLFREVPVPSAPD